MATDLTALQILPALQAYLDIPGVPHPESLQVRGQQTTFQNAATAYWWWNDLTAAQIEELGKRFGPFTPDAGTSSTHVARTKDITLYSDGGEHNFKVELVIMGCPQAALDLDALAPLLGAARPA